MLRLSAFYIFITFMDLRVSDDAGLCFITTWLLFLMLKMAPFDKKCRPLQSLWLRIFESKRTFVVVLFEYGETKKSFL